MLGLSTGFSWTHNRPTWIERSTSNNLHDSIIYSEKSSKGLPSMNSLQAWLMSETMSLERDLVSRNHSLLQFWDLRAREGWVGGLDERILCFCSRSLSLAPTHQSWRRLILSSRDHQMHSPGICSHWTCTKNVRLNLRETEVNYTLRRYLLCSHHFVCIGFGFVSSKTSSQAKVWNFWIHFMI